MGNPHGAKYLMRDLINIWKIKRNANPSYIVFMLTNILNVLENTYSVSGISQIQSAVSEIAKTGAGTIFIEAGTHEITESINLNNGGSVIIYGHGDNTILQAVDGIPILNITNATSVLMKNIKLDINAYTSDIQAIIGNESSNNIIAFENVTIEGDGTNGIGIELQSNNWIIENCNISSVNIGINILSTDNILQGNKVLNCNTHGIQISANNNLLMANTCSSNQYGIYLNGASYNLIDGNYCESNTEWGINLTDSNDNGILDNYCMENDGNSASPIGGIGVEGDSDNNSFIGNTSINNNNIGAENGYGMYLGVNTDDNYILANRHDGNDDNLKDLGNNLTFSTVGHLHDEATLQIDGINSNGGAFNFSTTGQVNFNQNISVPNLLTAGNVDGVDVSVLKTAHDNLKTDVDGFPDRLKFLTTVEINQLENINLKTISNVQWGYLGELDQSLKTTANVSHNKITLTAGNVVVGTVQLTDDEWKQLANIGVITISVAQWGYLGALDQALATTNSPTFAGLTLNGILDMKENLLILGNAGVADPIELLRFKTERAWSFRKRGVGANTRLALESDASSKYFWIGYDDGVVWNAKFLISSAQASNFADLYKLKIGGGAVVIDSILDEDDMVSDLATALATQQSIKAFVLGRLLNTGFSSNWSGIIDKGITADKIYDQFVEVANEMTALKYCLNFEGTWDASSGNPPDVAPADGDYWIVTTAGTWNGVEWELLDWIVWEATSAKWYKVKYFRQFPVVEVSGNDSIQSAIDQIIYMGGGIVKIHSGTYNNENDTFPLTINDGGGGYFLKIMGVGDSAIIDPNGDNTIFDVINIGKLILEDFKIDANDLITAEKEIINITEASNNPITIRSITITGDGVNGRGIEINSDNCKVEDCMIDNIRYGILCYGNDNTIQENMISSCYGTGIHIAGNKNSLYDNESDNNMRGITITGDYNQVNGNYIEGNTRNGIELNTASHNALNDNYCIGNDSNTVDPQAGIYIDSDCDNNTIISNTSINNNNAGAGKGYGIYIGNANCNGNTIDANKCSGNDVQYWDLGTNTEIEYRCSTGQEIQDAIDSIGNKSGIIRILIGTIQLSATININGGGDYDIQGEGEGSVIDCNGDRTAFNITSVRSCTLKNFNIDINDYTSVLQFAIDINEVGNHKIVCQNLHIYGDGTNGVGIWNRSDKCEVISCIFTNIAIGVYMVGGNYCLATDNYGNGLDSALIVLKDVGCIASNNIAVSCGMSVNAENATYFILEGNVARNCYYGIRIVASSYGTIEGNNVSGSTSDGIELTDNSDRNLFDGNALIGNGGYGINIATGCDNCVIGVNIYYNNTSGDINDNGIDTRLFGDNTVYGAGWLGDLGTPTKSVIYNKIESLNPNKHIDPYDRIGELGFIDSGTGYSYAPHSDVDARIRGGIVCPETRADWKLAIQHKGDGAFGATDSGKVSVGKASDGQNPSRINLIDQGNMDLVNTNPNKRYTTTTAVMSISAGDTVLFQWEKDNNGGGVAGNLIIYGMYLTY